MSVLSLYNCVIYLFPDDPESKDDDVNAEDKTSRDQPADEVNYR